MKTKIVIEVESPNADKTNVFPEEGQSDETFKGKEKELEDFRIGFAHDVFISLLKNIQTYFDRGDFEEYWLDVEDELYVEGLDSFDDYGIKVKALLDDKTKNFIEDKSK